MPSQTGCRGLIREPSSLSPWFPIYFLGPLSISPLSGAHLSPPASMWRCSCEVGILQFPVWEGSLLWCPWLICVVHGRFPGQSSLLGLVRAVSSVWTALQLFSATFTCQTLRLVRPLVMHPTRQGSLLLLPLIQSRLDRMSAVLELESPGAGPHLPCPPLCPFPVPSLEPGS